MENKERLEKRQARLKEQKKVLWGSGRKRFRFNPTLPSVREDPHLSELGSNVMKAEQRASARVDALGDQRNGHSSNSEPGMTIENKRG